jgi:hypothetical protein
MAITGVGTRGEPQAVPTGSSPTFAADISGLATWVAARILREFDTVAHMVASTGSGANEWAKCDNAPGALYYSDGTRWHLGSQPIVANSTARNALYSGTLTPDAGNTVFQLDTGAEFQYFTTSTVAVAGWFPVSGVVPFVSLGMTTAQNVVGGGVNTIVPWDLERSDALNWHDPTTNPSRITVPQAGRYRATRAITLSTSVAGQYASVDFAVNGTLVPGSASVAPVVSGVNQPTNNLTLDLILAAGAYVETRASAGTAVAVAVAQSVLQLAYIGPA